MTDSLNQSAAGELQRQLEIAIRQRDLLANAIAQAAVKTGGVSEGVDLTGPQLTMLVEDMAEHIQHLKAQAEKTTPAVEYNMAMGAAADEYIKQFGDAAPAFPEGFRWYKVLDEMVKHTKTPVLSPGLLPDFDAVKDARIGDLTPIQMDDALELWLRNQSGWFKDQEYLDFLLYRLDQARGQAPVNKPSQLGLSRRPGGLESSPWDANGPTLNDDMEALARAYGTLRHGLASLAKEIGLPTGSPSMTMLEQDNHHANVILLDRLATLMGVDFTQHEEPRVVWERPYRYMIGNPAFAALSTQYKTLADRLVILTREASGHSDRPNPVVEYPIQRQDAGAMIRTIGAAVESRMSEDSLAHLDDQGDKDDDEATFSPR